MSLISKANAMKRKSSEKKRTCTFSKFVEICERKVYKIGINYSTSYRYFAKAVFYYWGFHNSAIFIFCYVIKTGYYRWFFKCTINLFSAAVLSI